jgi:hypothetical protein
MLLKRDRDDEELDSLSLARLEQMDAKYLKKKSREELENQWKRITGSGDRKPDGVTS